MAAGALRVGMAQVADVGVTDDLHPSLAWGLLFPPPFSGVREARRSAQMERRGPLKDHCPVLPGQAGGALSRCSWRGTPFFYRVSPCLRPH